MYFCADFDKKYSNSMKFKNEMNMKSVKTATILVFLFSVFNIVNGQIITIVNKPLKDFPDVYDLSTPLNAGVTILYASVNGNENIWRDASVFMNSGRHKRGETPDRIVSEESKTRQLSHIINEVIVYEDFLACMITQIDSDYYSIRYLGFEDKKWLNIGEDAGSDLENARNVFYRKAPNMLNRLTQSNAVRAVSTDTLAFVDFLKQHGTEPKEFLLNALASHPLVIYGEVHRRKVSWDFLSSVLNDPRFPETVGTVFVELPAYQQPEFDRFYASKKSDVDILLEIFRSEQIDGWFDKGEYEFLINIWKLNQTLPTNKQIKVVAVDEQTPWKFLQTSEDVKNHEKNFIDRNTRMADVVEFTINTKADKRNCLFTVGYLHAYKSHVPGSFSTPRGQESALSAGAQLVQRFSDKNVFAIFQHVPMGTNFGAIGLVRQGLFDATFKITGNKPIAFNLADSPFGKEPFDADFNNAFDNRVGNYADNFDGYIFLQPLIDDDTDYLLYDIISDPFIDEMKRRITIYGWGDLNRWFDIEGEATTEKIIKSLKKNEGQKRWKALFE